MNVCNVTYRHSGFCLLASLACGLAVETGASAATISAVPASADTFVYQAMPSFDFDANGFERFLVIGKSVAGHELDGLIQFDVSGLSLAANQKATVNLYVDPTESTGFPGVSPTAAGPATADLSLASGTWNPATVKFGQVSAGQLVASGSISGTGNWVSFDVTSAVQGWLADPASNNGLILTQNAAVYTTGWVGLVFEASGGTNQPYLQISDTPEPGALLMLATALPLLAERRR